MGLYYTSFENAHTEVYADAAYANDKDTRRSWYGYIGYAWGNAVFMVSSTVENHNLEQY
jgi:hypothetical protein